MSGKQIRAVRLIRNIKRLRDVSAVAARTLQAVYYAVRLWE
ncbi:hypothetical protein [Streptomyces actinomycinicus]|nr:hypothetical protein [Streptomyces actinomycinicus]